MVDFDYVVVGAGPAGCVLANRLSEDPNVRVLLVEAGDRDTNPLIHVPGGAPQLLGDPATVWYHPTRPFGPAREVEHWVRGKTLGGSSSVNGMVYNRGSRADYDTVERLGNPGWGWDHMSVAFEEIEDGRLRVSIAEGDDPLLDDVITAGASLGWQPVPDLNESDEARIGRAVVTVHEGQRVSAAGAFLHPVMDRPNLTVAVRTVVDRVVFDGDRAVGVRGRRDAESFEATAAREVILAGGALATPKILQLSGIGPAETLRSAGVEVMVDSPNVGGRLREHRVFQMQVRLAEDLGLNTLLSTEEGRRAAMQEYQAHHSGVLARPMFEIVGFAATRPELDRPDAQFQIAPFSITPREQAKALEIEHEPGMMAIGYALRPTSEGSLAITSADPDAPLDIDTNYLATEYDRATTVGIFRMLRRLFVTDPLARRVERETQPGPEVETDDEIIDFALTVGSAGYHTVGTCAMGQNADDVVDPQLRVRGVTGLRVVDASVLPAMVSGNLNGPVTAVAWRAASMILTS